jgi:glucose-1-phosphate cytidylyltransferase
VDTGQSTQTGGRLKRLEPYLRDASRFLLTYGDGVSDVDLRSLIRFHEKTGCAATLTGVRPVARFGELMVNGERVVQFVEKPAAEARWVNGGYFVMTPKIFRYVDGDATILEREPLEEMAADGELAVYKHEGYWQCMDTYRDMVLLNEQWAAGRAPWKRWADPRTGRSSKAEFRPELAS